MTNKWGYNFEIETSNNIQRAVNKAISCKRRDLTSLNTKKEEINKILKWYDMYKVALQ